MRETPDDTAGWQSLLAGQVEANGRLCFRVAFGVLGQAAAAEDACQQAFLKAWESREKIQDAAALRAWLLRVVVNEALQALRRSKTERRVLNDQIERRAGEPAVANQNDMRESILLALAGLPEPTRTIVVMRLMDGRSGNEVKEFLGCSASEVSRRLHDGIAMLRGSLAEWATALSEKQS
jgi:RNA polymerase sigma factor (sigma-70 family)